MINYSIALMSSVPGTSKSEIVERKAYGVVQLSDTLDIEDFAQHITSHGCVYSSADIVAILSLAVNCIRELMLEGKKVKLGDFGSFQPRLRTVGAKTATAFTSQNIKSVNVSWKPGKKFENLRKVATFKLVPNRKMQAEAIEEIKNSDTISGLE